MSEFVFTPSVGEIEPLASKKIKIQFTPTAIKSVKRVFEVTVEDGNEWYLFELY